MVPLLDRFQIFDSKLPEKYHLFLYIL